MTKIQITKSIPLCYLPGQKFSPPIRKQVTSSPSVVIEIILGQQTLAEIIVMRASGICDYKIIPKTK